MSLQLNNQNDGYYDNVFLFDSTTFLFNEVRDLIAAGGGGGGGGGGNVQSVTAPLTLSNGVLNINLTNYAQNSALALKQDTLTAGTGITITGTTITATGGGTGGNVQSVTAPLTLANGVLAINLANYALNSALTLKQDTLTAGTGITITGSTISSTGGGGGNVQSVTAPLTLANGVLDINLTNSQLCSY